MDSKKCIVCKNVFYKLKTDSKKYWVVKKCCSLECSQKSQKNGKYIACKNCKKEFYRSKKANTIFCSRYCSDQNHRITLLGHIVTDETKQKIREARKNQVIDPEIYKSNGIRMRGSNHPNWKGGKHLNGDGYMIVLNREHPRSNKQGYVKEQYLVVEEKLRRYLTKEEMVHHINEIRTDNNISNLYLFSTAKEHRIYHIKNRFGKIDKILKSNLV